MSELELLRIIRNLNQRITELEAAQRWRKYPDEKPERDQTVLIYDGSIYVSTFFRDGFTDREGWLTTDDPDHWMPLPPQPEQPNE